MCLLCCWFYSTPRSRSPQCTVGSYCSRIMLINLGEISLPISQLLGAKCPRSHGCCCQQLLRNRCSCTALKKSRNSLAIDDNEQLQINSHSNILSTILLGLAPFFIYHNNSIYPRDLIGYKYISICSWKKLVPRLGGPGSAAVGAFPLVDPVVPGYHWLSSHDPLVIS